MNAATLEIIQHNKERYTRLKGRFFLKFSVSLDGYWLGWEMGFDLVQFADDFCSAMKDDESILDFVQRRFGADAEEIIRIFNDAESWENYKRES